MPVAAAALALVLAGCVPDLVPVDDSAGRAARPVAAPAASATELPQPAPSSTSAPPTPAPVASVVPAAGQVTIEADVLTYDEDEGYSYETFVVDGASDAATTQALVDALRRTSYRFMGVDETGVEHRTDAEVEAALTAGLYTPNWVSDPTPTPAGVTLYVDCKGVIPDPMSRTFRQVLAEELAMVGVPLHVSVARY